jgi:hypothetical protein
MEYILPASGLSSREPETGLGITLLEAYSALAKQNAATAAVEIPFPGQPHELDPNGAFWQLRIQKLG